MQVVSYLGHTIATSLFEQGGVAFDCGSNNGHFATWLSEHSSLNICSFEADPRLYSLLPKVQRVTFFPLAVAGTSGSIEIGLGESTCSSIVFRESSNQPTALVQATSLDDFRRQHDIDRISFIKMDIEGAELDVLGTVSEDLLQNTTQLSVEFHDMQNPDHLPRIREVTNRLQDLGFHFLRLNIHSWGDCLFINQRQAKLSRLDKLHLQFYGKYWPGCQRIGRRLIGR